MAEVKLTVWFNTDVIPYDAEPWKPEPQEGTVVERLFKNLTSPNPIVRGYIKVASKKKGRKRVPQEIVDEIREKIRTDARMPNGERFGVSDLARLYRFSEATIRSIIDYKGAYKKQG